MIADLYGDWREEIITALPGEIRIYTTNLPAKDRRTTLMQDGIYRSFVNDEEVGALNDSINLSEDDSITFVRLTMLAGAMF